jgi:hypothetical protein
MNFSSYLPSKKIAILGGTLFLSCLGIFIAYKTSTRKEGTIAVYVRPQADILADDSATFASKFANWQENVATITAAGTPTPSGPLSLTDQVTQKLLAGYSALQQSGTLDDTSANALAQGIVDDLKASTTAATKIYTSESLVMQNNATAAQALAWRNALNAAIEKYSYPELGDEIAAVNKALLSQTEADPAPLEKAHTAYTRIVKALIAIPVPKPLAPLDLLLINSFQALAESTQAFKSTIADPLAAAIALQKYSDSTNTIVAALNTNL